MYFRFLCSRRLDRAKGFLNRGDSTSILLRFVEAPFLIRSISSNPTHNNSFTVSYLVNSCGLSHEKAVSASKKVQFETSTKPYSVLNLLRNYGFTDTHISKFIQDRPKLLSSDADKTLKPKLDFFNSIGISGPELAQIISMNPDILLKSLENKIIPSIAFLKGIFHTESDVITVLKHSKWVIYKDPQKRLAPNIALLRTHGVPDSNILKLLLRNANTLLMVRFSEVVEETKKMKFDPSKNRFVQAIRVLSGLSKSSWDAKCDVFKSWGWSEEVILMAFKRQPFFMSLSVKKVMSSMEFLVNKMGYDPLLVSKCPQLLNLSLENRIIPRLSVIQVLVSDGIIAEAHNISALLIMSDKDFIRKYITKFEDKFPELIGIYHRRQMVNEAPAC